MIVSENSFCNGEPNYSLDNRSEYFIIKRQLVLDPLKPEHMSDKINNSKCSPMITLSLSNPGKANIKVLGRV